MGIYSSLKTALGYGTVSDYLSSPALASPYSTDTLTKIVWSDIFGIDFLPLTRAEAMSIPAMSKARNLICGTIAQLPLRAADVNGVLADDAQPLWMYRTDDAVSPFLRMLWTIDDLLFYGAALWHVTRGADGKILTADRVPFEWWTVSAEGEILIRDEPVKDDTVIYIPGPIEGVLDKDCTSLRSAQAIASAVATRAKAPIPVMEIHETSANQIDPIEATALVTDYNAARRDPEGATVFTPASVQLIPHGDKADSGAMVEARNAVRLDVANMTGVPASMLDGSVSQSSLTYSTQQGDRSELVDFSLSLWMNTVAGRLSADDVVPRGQRTVFDQADFLATIRSPIGPKEQD